MECLSCGLTSKKFLSTGLLGCRHCYPLFFDRKEVFSLTGANRIPKSRILIECKTALEHLYRMGISIRLRIARNFKNQYYGKANESLIHYMDRFLQRPELLEFSKYGNLYTFDEDHLRVEYFYSPEKNFSFPDIFFDKEIFDFQYGYGFLTACPTNSGRGNKISIKVPTNFCSEEKYEDIYKNFSESIISYKYESFFIIYLKNFNTNRYRNFLSMVKFFF